MKNSIKLIGFTFIILCCQTSIPGWWTPKKRYQQLSNDYPETQNIIDQSRITDKNAVNFFKAIEDGNIKKVKQYIAQPFSFQVFLYAHMLAERIGNQEIAEMITQKMKSFKYRS
jgi:hypothetical protein